MRSNLILTIAICFIIFALVPIFMVGNSFENYQFLNLKTFLLLILSYSIIFLIAAFIIIALLSVTPLKKLLPFFLYFSLCWSILSGFVFPIAASTQMVSPHVNPTNWLNFALVTSLSLIGGLMGQFSVRKPIIIFSSCVTLSVIPATVNIFSVFPFDSGDEQPTTVGYELSDERNILIFGLDSLSGKQITELVERSPELSYIFKDFTIFKKAIAPGLTTVPSLMGDLFGNVDYRGYNKGLGSYPYSKDTLASLPHVLNRDTYYYGYPTTYFDGPEIKVVEGINKLYQAKKTVKVIDYSVVRMFGILGHRVLYRFYQLIPQGNINHFVISNSLNARLKQQLIKQYHGPEWAAFHVVAKTIFDTTLSELRVKDKKLALRYFHFLHTHHPIAFDSNCDYRGDDRDWLDNHQNPAGANLLHLCALNSFSAVLNRLKALKIYDNSMIILKSDHGLPYLYYRDFPFNTTINVKPEPNKYSYGYGRYNATLFVKDFQTRQPSPIFSDEQVLTSDIGRTICQKLTAVDECHGINGKNLLDHKEIEDQPFYLEIPTENNQTEWIKIGSRRSALLQSLQHASAVQIYEPK